jgi:hypothetical protein
MLAAMCSPIVSKMCIKRIHNLRSKLISNHCKKDDWPLVVIQALSATFTLNLLFRPWARKLVFFKIVYSIIFWLHIHVNAEIYALFLTAIKLLPYRHTHALCRHTFGKNKNLFLPRFNTAISPTCLAWLSSDTNIWQLQWFFR